MGSLLVGVDAADPIARRGIIASVATRREIEAMELSECRSTPDVIVAYIESESGQPLTRVRSVHERYGVRIVIVAKRLDRFDVLMAAECGVVAVLSMTEATPARLTHVVRGVAKGRAELPPKVLGDMLARLAALQRNVLRPMGFVPSGLKASELAILSMVAEGAAIEEIGEKLSMTPSAVKHSSSAMVGRQRARSRSHLVAMAIRSGLI